MTASAAETHPCLTYPPCDIIAGAPVPLSGDALRSHDPAEPERTIWSGAPNPAHVDGAVDAARRAAPEWARWPRERRFDALRAFQALAKDRADQLARLLSEEVGKPLWEAKQEAGVIAAKVDITLGEWPLSRVTGRDIELTDSRIGRCAFRPHGVMAVLGPFNFPAHLPNGHIVPALAMGDTVVFKPSDKTPAVGQLLAELYNEALDSVGAPGGVVNLVQGAADVATKLVTHDGVDGVLFTGSWPVGRKILEANLDSPGRVVALELGGNNPAVVMDDAHLEQAVIECVRASFATAGQRCTCTRRLILHERIANRFLDAFVHAAQALEVGHPRAEPPVFLGPVIRAEARDAALRFASDLSRAGAEALLSPRAEKPVAAPKGHFVSPGVFRVKRFTKSDAPAADPGADVELFGPLVRVCAVPDLNAAIEQANATRYGLAASIFTTSDESQRRFLAEARAGCVNVNTGTAGASGKLPFGGLGWSGNHRPAGAFSPDYCAYPVASMIEQGDAAPLAPGMNFDHSWL